MPVAIALLGVDARASASLGAPPKLLSRIGALLPLIWVFSFSGLPDAWAHCLSNRLEASPAKIEFQVSAVSACVPVCV